METKMIKTKPGNGGTTKAVGDKAAKRNGTGNELNAPKLTAKTTLTTTLTPRTTTPKHHYCEFSSPTSRTWGKKR
jgi:hypothetical protein